MQKKIIAMVVAAAFVAPAAYADAKIYGKADVGVAIADDGDTSTTQIGSQVTKIGFKGSEDLDGGTSAIWQIEQQVNIDNPGTAGFASRNSFVGLKGDFGTALLGRHDTPYKIATRKLDAFADSVADNRNLIGGGHDTRLDNVIAYISPAMNGVTFAGAYAAGAETAASGQTKGSAYSLAAMYGDGPIFASLAYQSITYGEAGTGSITSSGTDDKYNAFKVGGSYTMDALKLNAVYERLDSSGASMGDSKDRNNYYLAGIYDLGGDDVKLAYSKAGDVNSMSGTGASQVSIGYDHKMSKNTNVYAIYTSVSNDSAAKYGTSTSGSTAAVKAAAAAGKDPSIWALGLKHSF